MIDDAQIAMLVYSHVVQLTLIDYSPTEAFSLAHRVAAQAFDADFTRAGLEAARQSAQAEASSATPGVPTQPRPSAPKR